MMKPHPCIRTWYIRRISSRPSTNPGSMKKLMSVVTSTERSMCSTCCTVSACAGSALSRPRAMQSTGRKTPMPYTPSPSQAHGSPQKIARIVFRPVPPGVAGADAPWCAPAGSRISTSGPSMALTAFSASATRPRLISQAGLSWARIRRSTISSVVADTVRKSHRHTCGCG